MKVKCIKNSGNYWFSPYTKISDWFEIGKIYSARDGGRYPHYGRDFDHYLIATDNGSKNFPASWFEKI